MTESPIHTLTGISAELIPDAGIAESRAIGFPDDLSRRSYVRAVFALIEGLNYARLRISTEAGHLSDDMLRAADVAVRLEKRALEGLKGRDDSGISSSMRTSFAAFAAAHGIANPLSPSGEAWQDFMDAIEVRRRLTHPRSGQDCRISDEDFDLVRRVHHWYQDVDSLLFNAAVAKGE